MKKYSIFAFYLFSGDLFVRILTFYANIYLGRTLGPTSFGLIIIGSSFLMYSLLLSDLGLKMLGFVETSKPDEKRLLSFSDIVNAKVFHATISFILLLIIPFVLYNGQSDKTQKTICIYFLLTIFFDTLFLDWYFKGLQRFKTIVLARICASLLYVITLYLFVKTPADVTKVPLLFFATNCTSAVILFIALPTTPAAYKLVFSIKKYLFTLKQSLPLGLGTLLNQVIFYLPPIILGKCAGIRESGYFGAALKIILLTIIIDKTFSTIFLSSLPRIWHNNEENARKSLQAILNCMIIIGFFISLILCISSEAVITLIFGNAYIESNTVMSIISWFFILTIINSIFVYGLIALDKKELYLKAAAIGFVINCILISVLSLLYGKNGAAIAIVLGELVFVILCYREFKKISTLSFYNSFIKMCIISAIAYYAITFLDFHIIIKNIVAVAVFSILTASLNIITKNDISLLMTKWKKS